MIVAICRGGGFTTAIQGYVAGSMFHSLQLSFTVSHAGSAFVLRYGVLLLARKQSARQWLAEVAASWGSAMTTYYIMAGLLTSEPRVLLENDDLRFGVSLRQRRGLKIQNSRGHLK